MCLLLISIEIMIVTLVHYEDVTDHKKVGVYRRKIWHVLLDIFKKTNLDSDVAKNH